jgi:ribonuclease HI
MHWIRVNFKGRKVWGACDANGQLVVERGLVSMRYSDKEGSKLYSAGAAKISRITGEVPVELAAGTAQDSSAPRAAKKSSSGRGSGFGSAGTRTAAQAAAAKMSAAEQIAAIPDGTHVAFTDGACKGNPGPAGAGAVVKVAGGETLEEGRYLGIATNNVGELTAVGMALDLLEGAGVNTADPVVLFTDSKYTLGVLTQGWKAKANKELILSLRETVSKWPNLDIRWVAGHVGITENERADELAGNAVIARA